MKGNRGNRSANRYTGGAPQTYWRGSIGREARAALSIMAFQDGIASRLTDQHEAEEQLIARLILAEAERRKQ